MLRDTLLYSSQLSPLQTQHHSPSLFEALELGWGGDPWGLEGVPEGAGYLGTLLFTPPPKATLASTPCPFIT